MTPVYDVFILGAGPAGSACAARLAEAGWSVAVVDRAEPGRPRVCGGFLGPEFVDWIEGWGWNKDFMQLSGLSPVHAVQISGSRPGSVETELPRNGFAVDRGIFDLWLAELAVSRGAAVWSGSIAENLGRVNGEWAVRVRSGGSGESAVIRAKHWVNATGRRPAKVGKDRSFFACKSVYRGVRGLAGSVALHFVDRGHIGLNPLSAEEATLCLCVDGRYLRESNGDLDRMMRHFLSANPNLQAQLGTAHRVSAWQTCQAEPDGDPVFFKDQKFFIGDALSMVNPVIGGGIPIAMHSGVMLADLLIKSAGQSRGESEIARCFERDWKKAFAGKFSFGKILGTAERMPALSRLALGFLTTAPGLLPRLVRMSRPEPSRRQTLQATTP